MLAHVFAALLTATAVALAIPVSVLFIEVVSALKPFRDGLIDVPIPAGTGRVAVVVPAHNESSGLLPTLSDLRPQLSAGDRLIVVADNCSDDTALVATAAGAEVLERNDLKNVGKGYALAHAIEYLQRQAPDFVLFVDADCRLQSDMLPRLKRACAYWKRPVQAGFLMTAPHNGAVNHKLAEFFWLMRNWVRPLGLAGLGFPVQLMGTGMMFPWRAIRDTPLANGHLVEDLKLGISLAAAGYAPRFYPFTVSSSEFPATKSGTESQRQRWIQGHILMIVQELPTLFVRAVVTRNWSVFVLALDMAVPPFSLLAPLLLLALAASFGLYVTYGALAPTAVILIDLAILLISVVLAWFKYGRETISIGDAVRLMPSVFCKASIYLRIYFGKKATSWIRTDRSKKD